MRAFINWLFVKNEQMGFFVKNDENNENWPNASTFAGIVKEWNERINKQRKSINQLEISNNKARQLMAEVQTWFINEHNLFKKPAKRALLEKEKKYLELTQEIKAYKYNLEHLKTELEEYEKQCLLNKIRISERKLKIVDEERKELTELFEKEKRELCLRLSYESKDLEPFLRSPEERLDPITRKLVISSKQYNEFWKKFHDIDPDEDNLSHPLNKLKEILEEWYEHNEGEGTEPNPHEIWVEEKTNDSLVFLWKPIEQVVGKDENGKEIEEVQLSLLKNYLFNYYGEWYEFSDYHQVGYGTVVIETQRSIFYNDYWALLKCSANVIVHHAPKTIASEEICSCPSYEIFTSRVRFDLEYYLKFESYRMGPKELRTQCKITDKQGAISMIFGGVPKKVNINEEWAYITGELFPEGLPEDRQDRTGTSDSSSSGNDLPFPNPTTDEQRRINEQHTRQNFDGRAFGRFMSDSVGRRIDNIGKKVKEFFTGKKSLLYILLSQRLNGGVWHPTYFFCPTNEEAAKNNPEIEGEKRNIYFKRVGKYDDEADLSSLTDETKEKYLEERGLLAIIISLQ
ncbi:MAG: hypothetical protein MRERC_4c088 [Mycoplasmataceae bacterium RC_NB112A]|nr:MAG: hypothetical protein MRERC_4c088 [Mycoplasmataceae bacterium RC_NB112A]